MSYLKINQKKQQEQQYYIGNRLSKISIILQHYQNQYILVQNLNQIIYKKKNKTYNNFMKETAYSKVEENIKQAITETITTTTNSKNPKYTANNFKALQNSKIIIFFILLSIFPYVKGYQYSPNLLINGDFMDPQTNQEQILVSGSIPGWSCTRLCQIKNCSEAMKFYLQTNDIDSNCIGQVIDLNSDGFNQAIQQNINLKTGKYQLNFNYYYPVMSANIKRMQVTFNDQTIFIVRPQVYASFDVFQYKGIVFSKEGLNNLGFANFGYDYDGCGFKLNNIALYRIIDSGLEQFLKTVVENGKFTDVIPGGRVIFRGALSFLMNFDRLQLYIYHNRLYSYNKELLLLSINDFLNAKSTLVVKILQLINGGGILNKEKSFTNYADFKKKYINYPSFNEDYQNVTYFDNLSQQFVLFFPLILITLLIVNIIFTLIFNHPFSRIFRKFSLLAILLIMAFDGSIQNLTFFTLAQFKTFFSNCFYHKVLNIGILTLFYAILFTVFALLLWGKFYYKKNVKYLLDESKSKSAVILGIMIDRGIICFLFGAVHQLLINQPDLQLLALIGLQLLWIIKKVIWTCKGFSEEWILILVSIIGGCLRVFLQITTYLYSQHAQYRFNLNQYYQSSLIYAIMSSAMLQMVLGIISSLRGLLKIYAKGLTNKVIDNHQQNSLRNQSQTKQVQIHRQDEQKAIYSNAFEVKKYQSYKPLKRTQKSQFEMQKNEKQKTTKVVRNQKRVYFSKMFQ